MDRRLLGFADADALAHFAAGEFARRARAAISDRGVFRVALAGGSTPRRMHEILAAPPFEGGIEWSAAQIFFGDERAVEPDHPDSNFNAANQALLNHLPLHSSQVHRMEGERGDLDAAARAYELRIARSFALNPGDGAPRFDLIVLGMGRDGHTASLFPWTAALRARDRWVVRNEVPQLDTHRLTLTYPVLNAAGCVLFLVSGRDKAETLERVLEGPRRQDELPAQAVAPQRGDLFWLVDEEAAAFLAKRPDAPSPSPENRS